MGEPLYTRTTKIKFQKVGYVYKPKFFTTKCQWRCRDRVKIRTFRQKEAGEIESILKNALINTSIKKSNQ